MSLQFVEHILRRHFAMYCTCLESNVPLQCRRQSIFNGSSTTRRRGSLLSLILHQRKRALEQIFPHIYVPPTCWTGQQLHGARHGTW